MRIRGQKLPLAIVAALGLGCTVPRPPPAAEPPAPLPALAPPPTLLGAAPAFSGLVARISTRGAEAGRAALEKALVTRLGEPYDPARVQEDLRALWALRLFDDVSVEAEGHPSGVSLTYVVVERPSIGRVSFAGAKSVPEVELAQMTKDLLGGPADPAAIDDAARAVKEEYVDRGYRAVRVESETARVGQGGVEVRLVVDEGPRASISRWTFTGNARAKEADLRAQMTSGSYNVTGGPYSEVRWERDAMVISSYYFDHGMLNVRVGPIEITASADGTTLTVDVPIVEGPVFKLGKIEVDDPAAKKGGARPALRLKRGEVFNRTRIKDELERVRTWYAKDQRRAVELSPATALDMTAGRVDLVLHVTDSKP